MRTIRPSQPQQRRQRVATPGGCSRCRRQQRGITLSVKTGIGARLKLSRGCQKCHGKVEERISGRGTNLRTMRICWEGKISYERGSGTATDDPLADCVGGGVLACNADCLCSVWCLKSRPGGFHEGSRSKHDGFA